MNTTDQLNQAAEYWKQFKGLPVSEKEMIQHLATFAKQQKAPQRVCKRRLNSNMVGSYCNASHLKWRVRTHGEPDS